MEVFEKLVSHMLKGVMIHEAFIDYYDFLNFKGFKKIHEYHYFMESIKLRKLKDFYMSYYRKLIEGKFEDPAIIPETWRNHTKSDVDNGIRQSYFKNGLEIWEKWEKETRALFTESYKTLMAEGEVLPARFIAELMDHELECVEEMILEYTTVDYSMSYIESRQDILCDKYCLKGIEY